VSNILSAETLRSEAITIPATDGYPLGALLYEPSGNARATVIMAAATAVRQSYYREFCRFLVGEGYRVVSFDYRGIGTSKPKVLRGFAATMLDWADKDFAGAVDHLAQRFAAVPLRLVGHSFGGHAIGFHGDNRIDRVVTIATGLADMTRHYAGLKTARQFRLAVKVFAPLSHAMVGYFPSRLFGLGEPLPSGVLRQWGKWCFTPGYCFGDPAVGATARFSGYTGDISAFAFADDDYVPPAAVEDFLSRFVNAQRSYTLITPNSGEEIGHFGFFRKAIGGALWPKLLEKL
jgi:predicted alpha/beta hydrolase